MTTIRERVAAARLALQRAGLSAVEADASARRLAEHVLGCDRARYLQCAGDPEPDGFADRYGEAVRRRARREPSAYITGEHEFWGLPLEVSPAVLIPRPETELIVEAALELYPDRGRPIRIADACTGSGNLAVALAHEFPNAAIVATDISPAALDTARRNAARHGFGRRIRFVRTNVLDGLVDRFELIVANPPYVKAGDRAQLQPEVRDYEPPGALFGGEAGTDVIAALIDQAAARLEPGGHLIFEFGFGQDAAVEALIARPGRFSLAGFRRDLQGIARTAVARLTKDDQAPARASHEIARRASEG